MFDSSKIDESTRWVKGVFFCDCLVNRLPRDSQLA